MAELRKETGWSRLNVMELFCASQLQTALFPSFACSRLAPEEHRSKCIEVTVLEDAQEAKKKEHIYIYKLNSEGNLEWKTGQTTNSSAMQLFKCLIIFLQSNPSTFLNQTKQPFPWTTWKCWKRMNIVCVCVCAFVGPTPQTVSCNAESWTLLPVTRGCPAQTSSQVSKFCFTCDPIEPRNLRAVMSAAVDAYLWTERQFVRAMKLPHQSCRCQSKHLVLLFRPPCRIFWLKTSSWGKNTAWAKVAKHWHCINNHKS